MVYEKRLGTGMKKAIAIIGGAVLGFIIGVGGYSAFAPNRSLPGDELGIGHELLAAGAGCVAALLGAGIGLLLSGKSSQ